MDSYEWSMLRIFAEHFITNNIVVKNVTSIISHSQKCVIWRKNIVPQKSSCNNIEKKTIIAVSKAYKIITNKEARYYGKDLFDPSL